MNALLYGAYPHHQGQTVRDKGKRYVSEDGVDSKGRISEYLSGSLWK